MQTYVRRDGFGNVETRTITDPVTHGDSSPESMLGKLVTARPFYHIPVSKNMLRSVRSPFTFDAQVIEAFGESMVKVRFTEWSNSASWPQEAVFYPRELHSLHACECAACKGDGIAEREGA